jgi:RNA polymerase sigma factor (TIGR02999 family)
MQPVAVSALMPDPGMAELPSLAGTSSDDFGDIGEVTRLLQHWSDGDKQALDRLWPLVYEELRRLAGRQLWGERKDHTLQVTALVNEAYLRLNGQDRTRWADHRQFLLIAATMMRRVLVDHARRQTADKRPPPEQRVSIEGVDAAAESDADLLALDAALNKLGELDPRQAEVVQLRYFTGLDIEETARTLRLSVSTVTREWRMARAWLKRELVG